MHRLLLIVLALGCGPKDTPPEAAAEAPAPTMEKPTPPAPEPAIAAPKAAPSNADLDVTLSYADGSTRSGHVVRIERSEDWFAEAGWTDKAIKTTVTLETAGTELDVEWSDVRTVQIRYGGSGDVSCQYDSSYTPWMYMCLAKTTTTATLADGDRWPVLNRHQWRFTFDDGESADFYLIKTPVRSIDDTRSGLETTENPDMYPRLKKDVIEMQQRALTRIEITP